MPINKDNFNSTKITENDLFEEVDIQSLKGNALAYAYAIAVNIPVFLASNKQLDLSLTAVNSNSSYTNCKSDFINITVNNDLLYRHSRYDSIPKIFGADYKSLGWFIDEYSISMGRSTRTEVAAVIAGGGRQVGVIGSSYVEAAMRTIVAYELAQDSIYVPVALLK